MDYTEVSNSIRMMMKAQGIDEMYIDKEETLYYDESGNVKHLIVKDGKLNADSDTVFVLGGVQADDIISSIKSFVEGAILSLIFWNIGSDFILS